MLPSTSCACGVAGLGIGTNSGEEDPLRRPADADVRADRVCRNAGDRPRRVLLRRSAGALCSCAHARGGRMRHDGLTRPLVDQEEERPDRAQVWCVLHLSPIPC